MKLLAAMILLFAIGCEPNDEFHTPSLDTLGDITVSDAALNLGLNVKQSEIHGMSQRGGSVFSHLRVSSDPIFADVIPEGKADIILSSEPMEALRYLTFLAPDGVVITNSDPFVNISNYPDIEKVYAELKKRPSWSASMPTPSPRNSTPAAIWCCWVPPLPILSCRSRSWRKPSRPSSAARATMWWKPTSRPSAPVATPSNLFNMDKLRGRGAQLRGLVIENLSE